MAQKIESKVIDDEVLSLLLPDGVGHTSERDLWDYKEFALEPAPVNATEERQKKWRLSRCELAKDIVAFYNSFGGYLVFGVRDSDRRVVGCAGSPSIDDLIRYCLSLTGQNIGLDIKTLRFQSGPQSMMVPVILVPRRSDEYLPAIFTKDGELRADGRPVFKNHDLYFRRNDECRPLDKNNPVDVKFLYQSGQRTLSSFSTEFPTLTNNLGPDDPELVRFVGREEYLRKLWAWTTERYSEVKVLSGLGGVGKTTIVRQFAEQVVERPCMGLTQLIWLTAKRVSFSALQNKEIPRGDATFADTITMLKAMLRHLAVPESVLESKEDLDDLMDIGFECLQAFPSLVIFDDIDSLPQAEQTEAFQAIVQLFGRTFRQANRAPSRAIITSRLELGAATRQLLKIDGLTLAEFSEFVSMMFVTFNLSLPSNKVIERLHKTTDGSPVFASSIIRLVRLGEHIDSAIQRWKNNSGEDVRKFAFERELDALKGTDRNVLYALCLLRETTRAELKVVLDVGDQTITDNLDQLRQYHLITSEGATPFSEPALLVPSSIQIMVDLIEKKVPYSTRIRDAVIAARKGASRDNSGVGSVVFEAMAHLKNDEPELVSSIIAKRSFLNGLPASSPPEAASRSDHPEDGCTVKAEGERRGNPAV
ncbi:MAG: putative DNA binding domain-containing protein, partial [Bryobacterales bacterium]|nr:putative DNA binding domain-containing protein [Bryobacterales bacterium]